MSEEIINNIPESTEETSENMPTMKKQFRNLCIRLGFVIIAIFTLRGLCTIIVSLMAPYLMPLDSTLSYVIQTAFSLLFLDVLPIISTALILKTPMKQTCGRIYSKPKYFGRALGMFPALYSLAIITNLLTMLLSRLFVNTDLNDSFNTMNDFTAPNMTCGIILFVEMAVLAPLFEEFWFRGLIMESLRPFGNGVAIFISALLFGLTHANFAQFFYAFVFGIFLGYIAIQTRSIVTTIVMHAMFNTVSASLLLLLTEKSVGDYLLAAESGGEFVYTPAVVIYISIMALMLVTMVVGFFMAIYKFTRIKHYTVPKVQTELSAAKRWGIFLSSATVIIGFVLAADAFSVQWIPSQIFRLFFPIFWPGMSLGG